MPTPNPVQIITAITAMIAAITGLVAAIGTVIANIKAGKALKQSEANAKAISDVHTSVHNMRN